jgi:hypothetical protein
MKKAIMTTFATISFFFMKTSFIKKSAERRSFLRTFLHLPNDARVI